VWGTAVPQLNWQRVLALAEGPYLERAEPVIFVGNPGLALLVCCQGRRVRFYTVTQLVNELAYAQQEHKLLVVDDLVTLFLMICLFY
jgi:hypothetical protein